MAQAAPFIKWFINPRNWVLLLGIGIIAVSLLADIVLNGTQTGIGPLQIIVACVGLALVILSRATYTALQGGAISLISVIVLVVIFEVILIVLGFPTEAPPPQVEMETIESIQYSASRICDETLGCRFVQSEVLASCGDNPSDSPSILCRTNAEGFNNPTDFTAENIAEADYRVLVLGDSFTWGASARAGLGWVDVLRDDLQLTYDNVAIWNAAIPGTGTNQAIITASYLLPIMQPDLVILGFHNGNDLVDNLYPYDRFIFVEDENGNAVNVQQYSLIDGEVIQETPQIIHYRALGYQVSSNEATLPGQVLGTLQRTRIGTLIIGAINVFNRANYQIAPTVEALRELQMVVDENESQFIIMIAPEQQDTVRRTTNYFNAVSAFEQVGIPYIDPIDLLTPDDFENPNPTDKHWNAQGQAVVGGLMTECVTYMIENDWEICPVATTP